MAELRCELARGEALRDVRGSIEAVVARELAALPGRLKPAFASIAVLKAQFAALNRRQSSLFAPVPDDADWRKIARLAWWTWRNR